MSRKKNQADRKRERDLDRLALLERINRQKNQSKEDVRDYSSRNTSPRKPLKVLSWSRYGRFRRVADLVLAFSMLSALWGTLAIGFVIVKMIGEDVAFMAGIEKILCFLIATTAAYGLLKASGELLILCSDVAELCNAEVESLHREKES